MMVRTPLGPLASCDRTITGFPSSLTWVNLTHPRLSFVNLASRGWPQPPSPLWWPGRSLQPQQAKVPSWMNFHILAQIHWMGPFFLVNLPNSKGQDVWIQEASKWLTTMQFCFGVFGFPLSRHCLLEAVSISKFCILLSISARNLWQVLGVGTADTKCSICVYLRPTLSKGSMWLLFFYAYSIW